MRGLVFSLFLLVVGSVSANFTAIAQVGDISGVWEVEIRVLDYTSFHRFTFEIDGNRLSGKAMWGSDLEGEIRGHSIQFNVRNEAEPSFGSFSGTLQADQIEGVCELDGIESTWVAYRPHSRPENSPRSHTITPDEFHRALSAFVPPVLKVFPGDTIHTTTLDSGGWDEKNIRRSSGGNPATGPFFIHGALPGDTLVVKFKKINLNRDSARSGAMVIPRAYSPFYLKGVKQLHWSVRGKWRLDHKDNVAVLEEVSGANGEKEPLGQLKNFSIPLRPMVGVVGVAPQAGSVNTRDSGNHGGNLDYNQIQEGTILYLPVYHPGALLFVGDGHAAQGDGELTGNALETSLELELEVDVLPNKRISLPRLESKDFLMSIGVHGSLTEALQKATSDLARWLSADYGLSSTEVALVLGTSIQYDVADLVGNQVSVVAKVSKEILTQ